jgi:hypothetical protein
MDITVNYLGVLLAAVAAMLVGMAWYSKALFLNQFVKLSGHKMDEGKKEGMGKTMAIAFASQLVKAFVLGQMISYNGLTSVSSAVALAFFLWLGFEATIEVGSVLWDGKSWKLFVLNASQELVTLCVMAIVFVLV